MAGNKEGLAQELLRALNVEAQDKRKRQKMPKPVLRVDIAGASYTTLDWSLNGLVVGRFNLAVATGTMVPFKLSDTPKGDTGFGGVAEVVRTDPAALKLVLHFYSLSPGTLGWLGDILFKAEKAAETAAPAGEAKKR
jgi:hypothetical protein